MHASKIPMPTAGCRPRHVLKALAILLAVAAMSLLLATPSSAGVNQKKRPPTVFVEQLPPPDLLAQIPVTKPSWVLEQESYATTSWSESHSCGSFYIDQVGYTHNYQGTGYTAFHVSPTWQYKYFLASDPIWDHAAWGALENCIQTYGPTFFIRSWLSIYQQFVCHANSPFSIGTGPTWDLEGHRSKNSNPITWVKTKCNW